MRMHFSNKLPEYVLAIQLVLSRGSQLHFGLFSSDHWEEVQSSIVDSCWVPAAF